MTSAQTPAAPIAAPAAARSYGQILKSSVLIGGSSIMSMGFGIIRNKAMAVLLGPDGLGLLGLYTLVYEFTRSVAGMGLTNSGVRRIAEAVGSEDEQRIARTVLTLRRVAFYTGGLGALLLLVFRVPVSQLTFKNELHAGALALLALGVFFGDVSAGQAALVQGMRRIADLARMTVLGAFYGTIFSIPIIYYYGQDGIVPALVTVSGMSILTSWWYARKVKVARVRMGFQETAQEAGALLRLGFVFMSTGLMTQGVAYLARVLILRSISLEAVGCYHAAWVFGGLYFGFILQAMGADFYPRLTAVARDNPQCNRLVNEQAEVGLLLGVPGLLATLALAPVVIHVFYSSKFGLAIEILRWICLGMVMRVACWPMGFILLAKGEGKVFFVTEVVANALQVSLIWLGLRWFSLPGTGMAFFALYVIYALGIYLVVRRMSGFRWSAANRRIGLIYGPLVAGVFVSFYFLPAWAAVALGVVASIAAGVYSVRLLCGLVSADKLPGPLIKGLRFLRLIS